MRPAPGIGVCWSDSRGAGQAASTATTAGVAPGPEAADALPEGRAALPASAVAPLVEQLPEVAWLRCPRLRLAEGLTPPTNRWFSGLVFGDEPQPVFPLPLAFGIDDSSFGSGSRRSSPRADHIIGSNQQDVNVEVAQAASTLVSAYDVASVTLETRDADGSPLGRTTVAEGSPFVSHVAAADETLTTSVPFTGSGDVAVADTATGRWGLRLHGATLDGDTVSLSEGDAIVLFPVPADVAPDVLAEHAVPLTATTASYAVGADEVTTELTYDDGRRHTGLRRSPPPDLGHGRRRATWAASPPSTAR